MREVPASGSSPAATFVTVIGDTSNTPAATTVGMWAQTSDPDAQIITQTYQGSTLVTPPDSTTGTLASTGWGYRTESTGSGSIDHPHHRRDDGHGNPNRRRHLWHRGRSLQLHHGRRGQRITRHRPLGRRGQRIIRHRPGPGGRPCQQ